MARLALFARTASQTARRRSGVSGNSTWVLPPSRPSVSPPPWLARVPPGILWCGWTATLWHRRDSLNSRNACRKDIRTLVHWHRRTHGQPWVVPTGLKSMPHGTAPYCDRSSPT